MIKDYKERNEISQHSVNDSDQPLWLTLLQALILGICILAFIGDVYVLDILINAGNL